ncbi:alginate lyase family protein [Pedobacter sp. PF22-3]|uniref:alginate lyase family protein n=1 Tax=Pedobacter sp. PF22-3 TaxID=2994467 RepID=UPI002246BBA7|nr:alginate lyase family protein [Pedobacter sp. PF22-3]MCX2494183.1 alginate lyase family protein [Pedobacter sp. PF22-3]
MRKFLVTIALTTLSFSSFAQLVSLNNDEIEKLKTQIKNDGQTKKLYQGFEKSALNYLNEEPNPIDTIRTEGLLKGNPKKEKTRLALADMNKMFALALQYRITDDRKYLNKCAEFLGAWAKINKPNGDPIDDTNLDKAIEAYDLIKKDISATYKKKVDQWLTETAWAEINSKRMKAGRATAINNWNAHRLKEVGEIGYTLNNQDFIKWTIDNLKSHININLYPDGPSLDFKERDAMHYHVYDLEPMLKLAIIIDRAKGPNFYTFESPKGSSIKKSVEWLIPYINGEKKHEEYVNTTVKFDRDRAKNNEPGFAPGSMFKPELALPVLRLSVYFDPSQNNLLQKVSGGQNNWQSVLEELKRKP